MRSLTRKGAATRQRILEGAAEHIREHGVAGTTLDDVLAVTAASKSQLFHYFPGGREELLLAVARYEAGRVLEDQRPQLDELTSWPAWQSWRDKVVDRYRQQGRLCPLNSVTSHLGDSSPGARAVVTELMHRWQGEIAAGVRHMQDTGEIDPALDADHAAAALLAGIQGGVLIQMSTGETAHLEAALDMGIAYLRGGRAPSP
ncbi:TetR/AcrR family transcriptional regulator [Microbispora sp. RL4-1S]|uniref:TetR/AcrR family transcriptional regulator n=1 Tax=Microbispora oryzae TaxID=2806554 RepID=A0A941AHY8_9ACTN|nr:TetR/AcrR family transcriptional regulator [Microbispora oryzae]MBP2702613.1 TetR/AcrR family transcriptional regulator [Microbispora oryzae]